MTRTTHDIENDHFADLPDSRVDLSGATASYSSGADLHTVIADLDSRIGSALPSGFEIVLGGGGVPITAGVKADVEMPFAGTITAARLFADQTGSIVVDVWKDTYANYPPTVADTITAAAKPTLSSADKYQDTTLTGWTTAFAAGDTLRINVDSATTVTRVTLAFRVARS
jgi:hypothetical protein